MRRTHQSGFSLIELMIVIVVLGVLMAIALPNYNCFFIRRLYICLFNELMRSINNVPFK